MTVIFREGNHGLGIFNVFGAGRWPKFEIDVKMSVSIEILHPIKHVQQPQLYSIFV